MTHARLQALLPYLIRWVGEGVVTALKERAQSEADGPGKRFMKVRANELHVHPSSQFKYMPFSDRDPACVLPCVRVRVRAEVRCQLHPVVSERVAKDSLRETLHPRHLPGSGKDCNSTINLPT